MSKSSSHFSSRLLPWLAALVAGAGCAAPRAPLPPVSDLDLNRFMGRWYEIAHYDVWYQRGMTGITDTYRRRADGAVEVLTEYSDVGKPLEREVLRGVARIPNPAEPGRWRLTFYWPFTADFYVIDVDREGYEWAVIGQPSRAGLWILSRSPALAPATYAEICAGLPEFGYDAAQLLQSEHPQIERNAHWPPPPRSD